MWLGSGCRREDGKEEVDEGGMESRMSRVDEGRGLPEWPAGSLPIWGRYQGPVLKPNASFDQSVTLTTPLFPPHPACWTVQDCVYGSLRIGACCEFNAIYVVL
jgi:hypothetical protein